MEWLDSAFTAVVALSWRAAILIITFAGLRWIGRRWIPARIIFAAWLLIAVRMLIPFSVPTEWSPYRFVRPVVDAVEVTIAVVPIPAPTNSTSSIAPANLPLAESVPINWSRTRLLGFAWLSGLVALLSLRVVAGVQLDRLVRRGRCADDPRLLMLLDQIFKNLGLPTRILITTSTALHVPAIAGLWRPRLLIPAGFSAQLSDEELQFVLRHEIGHWRRRDILAHTIIHLALAVHWFNPLAWFASRLARRDCELACDEFVLRSTSPGSARAYGTTLLKALGSLRPLHPSPAALGIYENKRQLKRRIEMIIGYKPSNLRRTLAGATVTGLLVLISLTHEIAAEEAAVAATTTTAPQGWFENGSKTDSYVVGVDSTQKHVQPFSAYVKSTAPEIDGFGGIMQNFSAEDYRGKRVRFSAWVKTAEVPGGANLWMRIDGPDRKMLAFDNMSDRAIKDTADWTACAIVLDVAPDALNVNFGFFISGTGQAWVNDAKFEVVGADVATTGRPLNLPIPRKTPENLAFSPAAED